MTILAFDYGEKRIGVAVGDEIVNIAHPLTTISAEDTRFGDIAALIKEWQPTMLLVGLPSYMDGTEHEVSQLCRRFARCLHGRFNLPVQMWDERLSSMAATQALKETGKRRQKTVLDQVAAQLILQSYLDAYDKKIILP
jgi:putative Holliday junction resolvase